MKKGPAAAPERPRAMGESDAFGTRGKVLRFDQEARAVLWSGTGPNASRWTLGVPPAGYLEQEAEQETKQEEAHETQKPRRRRKRPRPRPEAMPPMLRDFTYSSSPDGHDDQLLLLFHGLGDTQEPFDQFAKTVKLPRTATLALRAPLALPMDLGFTWFDAVDLNTGDLIRPSAGERRRDDSLGQVCGYLEAFLAVLQDEAGWDRGAIFLLGFSMGATVAMEWAYRSHSAGKSPFAGLVCVAGALLEERILRGEAGDQDPGRRTKSKGKGKGKEEAKKTSLGTDALVIAGSRDQTSPVRSLEASARLYRKGSGAKAEVTVFDKGHRMVASKEEMRRILTFVAERMESVDQPQAQAQAPAPDISLDDAFEVSTMTRGPDSTIELHVNDVNT